MKTFVCFTLAIASLIAFCDAHGMMIEPVGRASRWRSNSSAPVNWDDNETYCGGFGAQWNTNNGKCGLCGDNYSLAAPRPHELGGVYGEGVIVKTYKTGGTMDVTIDLHTNHWGTFFWDICNIDSEKESDECFGKNKLKLVNGSDKYTLETGKGDLYKVELTIPEGLKCEHCVLRWTYRTANSWGECDNGKGAMGCGPQEHFRSCADVSITA